MENKENAIEVRNVKKHFKVYYDRGITFKDKVLSRGRNKYEKREVLKGISFAVKKGEAIGLIGRNGCGKSTTLKLLTKIIYPNEGTVELQGRVSSLLELGAGFHPDMSGRENIYMNAAVFGLNRKEIDKRLADIIKFSELEDFIDNPIRTYSSGMYMRLAFSVAINVDADILLIDEILAVGDISFQKKCFEKLKEIKMNGTTIVIVSHSLDQIEKICDRSIWIVDGEIKEEGTPKDVHEKYLFEMEKERLEKFQAEYFEEVKSEEEEQNGGVDESSEDAEDNNESTSTDGTEKIEIKETEEKNAAYSGKNAINRNKKQGKQSDINIQNPYRKFKVNLIGKKNKKLKRKGNQKIHFTQMYITDSNGQEKAVFETGDNLNIYLKYVSNEKNLKGTFCLLFYRDDGTYCYGTNTYIEQKRIINASEVGFINVFIKEIPLLAGKYYITLGIHDEQAVPYDDIERAAILQIFSNKGDEGIVRINTGWNLR